MIDVNKYKDYYFQTAKKIFSVPSPTGYYTEIANVIEEFAKENGAEFSRTAKGCFVLTVRGKKEEALGLCAHADTLGAMVRSFTGDKINFTRIGVPYFRLTTANTARLLPETVKNIRELFFR